MITAPFPSTAFRTRVPTRSVPRSSRGAAWLTPAGSPAPPRSCPRIVPAHSRDDHTIRRNLMCVPARRKPKTKKARLAVWHLGTPRALQPFVSFDSSSSTFSGNCRKYQQKQMSYDQTVCRLFFPLPREIDSAATRNALDSSVDALARNRQPAFSFLERTPFGAGAKHEFSLSPPEVATRGRAARGVPGGRSVGEARCDARLVVGG